MEVKPVTLVVVNVAAGAAAVADGVIVAVGAGSDHSACAYFAAAVDRVDAEAEADVVPVEVVVAAVAQGVVVIGEGFEDCVGAGAGFEEVAVAQEAEELVTAVVVAAEAEADEPHLHLEHSSRSTAGKKLMAVSQHDLWRSREWEFLTWVAGVVLTTVD